MLVVIVKETESGCWDVVSHKPDENGYSCAKHNGKAVDLHRLSYIKANPGTTPAVVRHTCDNPRCINPAHLIPGTHADNVADRVARGRSAKGCGNGRAKITEAQVAEILSQPTAHENELAKRYGIDRRSVRKIRMGETWRHVPRNGSQS